MARAHDALVLALIVTTACRRHEQPAPRDRSPAPVATVAPDVIRSATGPITIDGEWHEPDWPARALRVQLVGDDGQLVRPYSEARFLHDDRELFVALYAADENIESTDAFELSVGTVAFRVDTSGTLTPPNARVRAKVDFDEGTRDDPRDDDEEWVVELAIPLELAGLARGVHRPVKIRRCDTPKDHIQRCGSWSGALAID